MTSINKKITSIIIEDEPLASSILSRYIIKYGKIINLEIFSNAIDAKEYLKTNNIDLIFLDIHLPILKGLDYLKEIENQYPVILTTAYSTYALNGYDLGVVDYLLKPIEYSRFEKAANRALSFLDKNENNDSSFIYLQVNKSKVKVIHEQINYIESDRGYLTLHLEGDGLLRTKFSITKFIEKLPSQFIRIHKSHIINIDKISSITSNYVTMSNGYELNIGRKYKEETKLLLDI